MMIVAAVVDWLLRPEIAQKQGKQVPKGGRNVVSKEGWMNGSFTCIQQRDDLSSVSERRCC